MAFLVIGLLAILVLGLPIAFALGMVPTLYLLFTGKLPLDLIIQQQFTGVDSFVYLAVPFFILAGVLMSRGGISERLIDFTSLLVGKLTGGLAMTVALASMIFASISGSGPATTAAIGGSTLPALVKRGYGREWSVALMASAGTIGPLIPPSITMVIYGAMAGVSIGALFLAGIVPGVMIGLGLMVISWFHARKVKVQDHLDAAEKITWRRLFRAFLDTIWAFGMPVVIMGGILGGIFTPTEAAVVSVVYAFIVSFFIYRSLTLKDLPAIILETAVTTAVVMIILANAAGFAWLISAEKGPEQLVALFQSVTTNRYLTLLLINLFLFVLGCLLDTTSAMVMTFPALLPLAQSVGVSAMHLGLIMCTNLIVGMATPPVGLTLFTACSIGKVNISQTVRPLIPMIAMMFLTTLFVTYLPEVALYIPRLLLD